MIIHRMKSIEKSHRPNSKLIEQSVYEKKMIIKKINLWGQCIPQINRLINKLEAVSRFLKVILLIVSQQQYLTDKVSKIN